MMADLETITANVRTLQDGALAEREQERAPLGSRLAALRAARSARQHHNHSRVAGAAAIAVLGLAASLTLFAQRQPSDAPLSFDVEGSGRGATGMTIAPTVSTSAPTPPIPLHFSDGSEIDVAPSAALRVASVSPFGAEVVLDHGTVHTHVVPRAGNKWSIAAGPYRVHVKGTRFDTTWDPVTGILRVAMQEGRVLVTSDCLSQARELSAGDTAEMTCESKATTPTTSGAPPLPLRASAIPIATSTLPASAMPSVLDAPAATTTTAATATTTTATSAHAPTVVAKNKASPAIAPRAHSDSDDDVVMRGLPEATLNLAETARLGGRFVIAERAYRSVRARFGGSEQANRATFLLGRMLADGGRDAEAEAPSSTTRNGTERHVCRANLGAPPRDRLEHEVTLATLTRTRARIYLERFPAGALADVARASLTR